MSSFPHDIKARDWTEKTPFVLKYYWYIALKVMLLYPFTVLLSVQSWVFVSCVCEVDIVTFVFSLSSLIWWVKWIEKYYFDSDGSVVFHHKMYCFCSVSQALISWVCKKDIVPLFFSIATVNQFYIMSQIDRVIFLWKPCIDSLPPQKVLFQFSHSSFGVLNVKSRHSNIPLFLSNLIHPWYMISPMDTLEALYQ